MVVTTHLRTNTMVSSVILRTGIHGFRRDSSLKNHVETGGGSKCKAGRKYLVNKPVFMYAKEFKEKIALRDKYGEYKYGSLLAASIKIGKDISDILEAKNQQRIAFLCPNDANYVITQWGCWISGQIAVPLSRHYPLGMLEYLINDCAANLLIATKEHNALMQRLATKTGRQLIILDECYRLQAMDDNKINLTDCTAHFEDVGFDIEVYRSSDALILYTSGSTGYPKGVVLSHNNLAAQISSQLEAWEWRARDVILHVLPLHHIHGVVNALMCPFSVGAKCIMLPSFNPGKVWSYFLSQTDNPSDHINLFMGVPTMYVKLLEEYERTLTKSQRMVDYVKAVCSSKIRLMVSGSAPLSEEIFKKWQMVTGHMILERYGMTEIGMALSNPLYGSRKPGFVGIPMPGAEVRIVKTDDNNNNNNGITVLQGTSHGTEVLDKDTVGQLQVKGDSVFSKYWGRPEATSKEFTNDGWFKTGDIAEYVNDSYRILGRSSVDIIKTGGYKVSALQIESVLLEHPDIVDVAVVGLLDITWGQKIAAVIQLKEKSALDLRVVQRWVKMKLPLYAIPTVLKIVSEITRNPLGKINKVDIVKELFEKKNI